MRGSYLLILLVGVLASSCSSFKLKAPDKDDKFFTVAWAKNLDLINQETGNRAISTAAPLIYQGMLFIGDHNGYMSAYHEKNGSLIWKKKDHEAFGAQAAIYQERLYYGSISGRFFARNYLTGKLHYAIDLKSPVVARPVLYQGRLFIHLRNHSITALDAATGKLLWTYKRSIPYLSTLQKAAIPLPYKNKIIVGMADGNVIALSVEEGIVLWEQSITNAVKFVDVDARALLFHDKLFVGSANGPLHLLNPDSGLFIRTTPFTIGHTPYVLDDNTLAVGSVYGEVALISKEGNILQKKKISKKGIGDLVLWKGQLVANTFDGRLISLDVNNLEVQKEYLLGSDISAVFGEMTSVDGYLAIFSSRSRLYIFR